jgi:hypothetical protein
MGFRHIELMRAGWGAALLLAPREVLSQVPGVQIGPKALVVARILGIRHLVQASFSGVRPTPEILAAGVWVDLVHSLTALGLAVTDHRHVRAALADSVVAAVWCAAGCFDLCTGRFPTDGDVGIRDRLSRSVLNRLPGGRILMKQALKARAAHHSLPNLARRNAGRPVPLGVLLR